jgi:hypothetical protein
MRLFWISVFVGAVCVGNTTVAARADFDVSPAWSGVAGQPIVTHGYSDDLNAFTSPMRVFHFAFDDPSTPNTTGDPGFHALAVGSSALPAGSGLPNGDQLTFDVLSNLEIWNGSSYGPAPAGVTLSLISQRDPNLMVPTVTTGAQSFVIATIGGVFNGTTYSTGDQGLHEHLTSVLSGPGGSNPTDGIYLFEMDLRMANDANVGTSLPYFVIYDHQANRFDPSYDPNTDPTLQGAISYAQILVPEPSGFILAGFGGALALCARFRRRLFVLCHRM